MLTEYYVGTSTPTADKSMGIHDPRSGSIRPGLGAEEKEERHTDCTLRPSSSRSGGLRSLPAGTRYGTPLKVTLEERPAGK
jgi:hypothetical protein